MFNSNPMRIRCHKSTVSSGPKTDSVDTESRVIGFMISFETLAEYFRSVVSALEVSLSEALERTSGST